MALKIGDRCIITRSDAGDEGRIVMIVDYISPDANGDIVFGGYYWIGGCDVIIAALDGGKLQSMSLWGAKNFHTERPHPSNHLRKLPDVTEEITKEEPVTI